MSKSLLFACLVFLFGFDNRSHCPGERLRVAIHPHIEHALPIPRGQWKVEVEVHCSNLRRDPIGGG